MTGAIRHAFDNILPGRREGEPVDLAKTPDKRVTGKIIKVSPKGFGFISCKEIPFTRIFFHWTSLKQDTLNFALLHQGHMVEFTPRVVEGKGTRAIKIKVLPDPVVELTPEEQEEAAAIPDSATVTE